MMKIPGKPSACSPRNTAQANDTACFQTFSSQGHCPKSKRVDDCNLIATRTRAVLINQNSNKVNSGLKGDFYPTHHAYPTNSRSVMTVSKDSTSCIPFCCE